MTASSSRPPSTPCGARRCARALPRRIRPFARVYLPRARWVKVRYAARTLPARAGVKAYAYDDAGSPCSLKRSTPTSVADAIVVRGCCTARGGRLRGRGSAADVAERAGGATRTLFDLASLTKPMTAVAVARAGTSAATRLCELVARARGDARARTCPMELFLSHRAGLDGARPLFAPLLVGGTVDRDAAIRDRGGRAARGRSRGKSSQRGLLPPSTATSATSSRAKRSRARPERADAGEAIAKLVVEPLGLGAEPGRRGSSRRGG